MSEHTDARYRSSRWPESDSETLSSLASAEDELSEITESPVDPKTTTSYRFALGAVIGLGALIVVCLIVLVVGLGLGWNRPKGSEAADPAKKPLSMTLAPGFRILSSDTQPGRLILHVRSDAIDEIDIIDLNNGRIISQIHAETPK